MSDPRFHPPAGGLVPHMGITLADEGEGWLEAKMVIEQHHLRSGANALHAASMIALADSVCGFAAGPTPTILDARRRCGAQSSRIRKPGAISPCSAALR